MPSHVRSTLFAALALAASPAAADAADRYVSKTGSDASKSCGVLNPCLTIQQAIALGQSGDTINIGPGTYDEGGLHPGAEVFHFVGAAAGKEGFDEAKHTRIRGDLKLEADGSSVRDLSVAGTWTEGLRLRSPGGARSYLVEDVVLIGGVGGNDEFAGLSVGTTGPVKATVRRAAMFATSESNDSSAPAALIGGGDVQIEDSTIEAPFGSGLHAYAGATARLVRSTVSVKAKALIADNADVTVERSRLTGGQGALKVISGGGGSSIVTATDSLFVLPAHAYWNHSAVDVQAGSADTTSTAVLRRSTVLAHAEKVRGAVELGRAFGGTAVLELDGTVVRATDLDADTPDPDIVVGSGPGQATATASHSSFTDVEGLDSLAPGSGTNVTGDPMLDADGVPLPGSPLIDRGDATALPASALDLTGNARVQDGAVDGQCAPRVDIGVFERAAGADCTPVQPPEKPADKPVTTGGGTQNPVADTVKPVIGGVRVARRVVRWTLSEAAATKIKVQRRKGARWVTVRRLSVAGKAGANALRLKKLTPGRYRARLTAADAAGNTATAPAARFRIR